METYATPYAVTLSNYPFLFYDYHPLVNPVTFSQDVHETPTWMQSATAANQQTQLPVVVIFLAVGIVVAVLTSAVLLLLYVRHRKTVAKMK
jgi:hypothetical protein